MAKKTRAAVRKVKDKWRAKNWYNIYAPEMFSRSQIGETLTDDPQKLLGRVTEVTVQDLTGDFSKMHMKLQFKVNEIKGSDAHTQFVGHDLTSDYLRRLTRRRRTRTDGTFDVYTKEGAFVRVKPMAITDRRIQASKEKAIRRAMEGVVKDTASKQTLGEFVKSIISGDLAKNIALACKPIQPIQRVEIRKTEVKSFGEVPKAVEEKVEEKEVVEGKEEEKAEEVVEISKPLQESKE